MAGSDNASANAYWGLFVGTDGGPWHWICEEAMNTYQQRRFALGKDGTLYATDRVGLTVSRDEGCTWTAIVRDIHRFGSQRLLRTHYIASLGCGLRTPTRDLAPDSWRSDDRGNTWQLAFALSGSLSAGLGCCGRRRGVGANERYSGHAARADAAPVHRWRGELFQSHAELSLNGMPALSMVPLWIDPRTPDRVYVATQNSAPMRCCGWD